MSNTIVKWAGIAIAAPGASTDILATEITTTRVGSWLKVTIAPAVSTVVMCVRTSSITGAKSFELNDATATTVPTSGDSTEYTFAVPAPSAEYGPPAPETFTYNFQVVTDSIIEFLHIEEHPYGIVG